MFSIFIDSNQENENELKSSVWLGGYDDFFIQIDLKAMGAETDEIEWLTSL